MAHGSLRSTRISIAGLAAVACTAAFAFVGTAFRSCATAFSYCFERVVLAIPAPIDSTKPAERNPVLLDPMAAAAARAWAYALSVAKRERPRVRHQWRMCATL